MSSIQGATGSDVYQEASFSLFSPQVQEFIFEEPAEESSYWGSCPSVEEVEAAVSSAGYLSPSTIEIHRLDTGDRIPIVSSTQDTKKKSGRKGKKKSPYKHVPHSEKPAHLVEKRNARERRRVEAVNSAFVRLRKAVPIENKRGKRVSKVKVLQKAIDYILAMREMISEHDGVPQQIQPTSQDDDHLFAF